MVPFAKQVYNNYPTKSVLFGNREQVFLKVISMQIVQGTFQLMFYFNK